MKHILPLTTLISSLALSSTAKAQEIPQELDPELRMAVFATNTAVNTAICGVVAIVEDRNVGKDMAQCFGGATLQYIGMEMGVHNVPVLPGVGLRITETGTSIIYNTLQGKEPFETLHYSLGVGLVEINTKDPNVNFYFDPLSVVGVMANLFDDNQFSLEDTVNYQTPIFYYNNKEKGLLGRTIGQVFFYDKNHPEVKAHEFTHVMQHVRYRPAQLAIPDSLDFIEEDLHIRLGEDLLSLSLSMPSSILIASGGKGSRYWWDSREAEAYIMKTGHENYGGKNEN